MFGAFYLDVFGKILFAVFVPIICYAGLVIEGAIEALIDWLLSFATAGVRNLIRSLRQ